MLTFRNTNIIFLMLLAGIITLHILSGISFFIYPALFILYSLVLFYGCTYIRSGFFMKINCSANTGLKEIAISFDDGPAKEHTLAIVKVLEEAAAPATFFCIGNRIAGNEDILSVVKSKGHLLGNHSYSHHFWFDLFSAKKMLEDMRHADHEIEEATGLKPKLFRPPYGVMNPNLKKAILHGGYYPVGWSVRSFDTVIKDENKLLDKTLKGLAPGAVYLFHDTCAVTLKVLPRFLKEVKNQGYRVVPLDKLLHLTPYA